MLPAARAIQQILAHVAGTSGTRDGRRPRAASREGDARSPLRVPLQVPPPCTSRLLDLALTGYSLHVRSAAADITPSYSPSRKLFHFTRAGPKISRATHSSRSSVAVAISHDRRHDLVPSGLSFPRPLALGPSAGAAWCDFRQYGRPATAARRCTARPRRRRAHAAQRTRAGACAYLSQRTAQPSACNGVQMRAHCAAIRVQRVVCQPATAVAFERPGASTVYVNHAQVTLISTSGDPPLHIAAERPSAAATLATLIDAGAPLAMRDGRRQAR
eukprot:6192585-Pleurochrysis_carterae.AAC.2